MGYRADLTLYEELSRQIRPDILNAGWLDGDHKYPTGTMPESLLEKLFLLCLTPVNRTRGFEDCEICDRPGFRQIAAVRNGKPVKLGDAEIFIFSPAGKIYAAPTLIYHYIDDHTYLPPQEFLAALETCPLPESPEYQALYRAASIYK